MSSDTVNEFDGGETVRMQSEMLGKYKLDQKAPTLVVLLGLDTGLRIPLDKPEITLGRTNEADVMLHDEQISRRHAVIRCDPATMTYTLVDLKSTNGTRLNLQQITEVVLKEGDKIFVGTTVLKFTMQDELESEHEAVVNRWAFIDDLTGLVVKRHFYRQLRFEVRRAQEAGERLALLMMDMDGLKAINDANGHSYGAFVISQVGRLIGEVVGPVGQACRYGGDEFVAYLQNHDLKMAMAVGERIRATVQEHLYEKDGKTLRVTISIGAAEMGKEAQDPDALNKAADEALYRAKAKGRNRVSD